MKRRTSNSASETNETSSRSGTRGKMGAAVVGLDEAMAGPFGYLLNDELKPKTKDEAIEMLKRIGLFDESGELAEKYRDSGPKKRKGRAKKQPPA